MAILISYVHQTLVCLGIRLGNRSKALVIYIYIYFTGKSWMWRLTTWFPFLWTTCLRVFWVCQENLPWGSLLGESLENFLLFCVVFCWTIVLMFLHLVDWVRLFVLRNQLMIHIHFTVELPHELLSTMQNEFPSSVYHFTVIILRKVVNQVIYSIFLIHIQNLIC